MTFSGLTQSIESIWMRNLTFFVGNMFWIFFFLTENLFSKILEAKNKTV